MVQRVCNTLLTAILLAVVLAAGVLVVPKWFGIEIFAVQSGSMEPKYHVGSVVFVQPAAPETIKVGDPITFRLDGQSSLVATHRVTAIDTAKRQFTTKGDANEVEDMAPQSFDKLIGKVRFSIPVLGYVTMNMKTRQGIIVGCVLLIVIILLAVIPEFFKKKSKKD